MDETNLTQSDVTELIVYLRTKLRNNARRLTEDELLAKAIKKFPTKDIKQLEYVTSILVQQVIQRNYLMLWSKIEIE